jgi:hypothetical protein
MFRVVIWVSPVKILALLQHQTSSRQYGFGRSGGLFADFFIVGVYSAEYRRNRRKQK